jgi:D-3-phosphoglycerate dehydrogenase
MRVVVTDPYVDESRAKSLGVRLVYLDGLLGLADVISVHVPLTEETRGLIGEETIRRMRSGALVINVSRGGVIDEGALAVALVEGRLGGAALDVFDREPLALDSPLRAAPNLILTPHLGAATREAQVESAREVALAVRTALADGTFAGAVNARGLGDR